MLEWFAKEVAPGDKGDGLPLFAELPRAMILGNLYSGYRKVMQLIRVILGELSFLNDCLGELVTPLNRYAR